VPRRPCSSFIPVDLTRLSLSFDSRSCSHLQYSVPQPPRPTASRLEVASPRSKKTHLSESSQHAFPTSASTYTGPTKGFEVKIATTTDPTTVALVKYVFPSSLMAESTGNLTSTALVTRLVMLSVQMVPLAPIWPFTATAATTAAAATVQRSNVTGPNG
jgi:hypothetical protein